MGMKKPTRQDSRDGAGVKSSNFARRNPTRKATRAAKSSYVLQVIPLWVEKNKHLRPNIWKLVVVDCSESIQKYRATTRSKIDAFTFNKIKLNQAARSSRIELADYVIDNNGTIDTLEPQVSKIHNLLLNNV